MQVADGRVFRLAMACIFWRFVSRLATVCLALNRSGVALQETGAAYSLQVY